ncbi:MAG: DegT/DnrJ/EryC1/StrS family aminotransferase [Bacteroidota bacterium]
MNFIPLSSPDIREEDIEAVNQVLRTGMLVQSHNVKKFEDAIVNYTKAPYACAVSNGTATMHLALIALGIGKGDEVIVPAFSYIATANVVELVGATPVFVDIDIETFNIDVTKIRAKITSNTKAIIPVHEFGLACDIEAIVTLAKEFNIHIVEDAACALGATQNGKFVGTYGIFGSFSLHPRKAISSGEGGMITTSSELLYNKVCTLRNHGIEMIDGRMEFVEAGYNYRMTDFQAALVNSQFSRLPQIIASKQLLAEVYYTEIKHSKVTLPVVPQDRNHTWQTFHVLMDDTTP